MTIQTHIQRIWTVCFSLIGMCTHLHGSYPTTPAVSPINQDLEDRYAHIVNHHWYCAHALCIARTAQDTVEAVSYYCRTHKPTPTEASKLLAYLGLYSVQLLTAWSVLTGIKHWRLLESSLRYSYISPQYYAHVLRSLHTSHVASTLLQNLLFVYALSDRDRIEECRLAWDSIYNDDNIWSDIESEIQPDAEFDLFYTTCAYMCDSSAHAHWDHDTCATVLAALAFFYQPANIRFLSSVNTTTNTRTRYLLHTHAPSLRRILHATHAHFIQDQDL